MSKNNPSKKQAEELAGLFLGLFFDSEAEV
jgi:hypothetical protein